MFVQIKKGMKYPLRGIRLFYSDRSLWRYCLIPFGIILLVYIPLTWGSIQFSAWVSARIAESVPSFPDSFARLIECLIFISGVLLLITLLAFSVTTLYEIFGGLFFDKLIEEVERKYDLKTSASVSANRNLVMIWDGLVFGVKMFFLTVFLSLAGLLLPLIGEVVIFFILSWYFGISYITLTGYSHGMRWKQQRLMAKKHKMLILGYGLCAYLFSMIPFLFLFIMPGIIIGGTLLFNQELQDSLPLVPANAEENF